MKRKKKEREMRKMKKIKKNKVEIKLKNENEKKHDRAIIKRTLRFSFFLFIRPCTIGKNLSLPLNSPFIVIASKTFL